MFSIFLVEDDPWYGELLKHHLTLNPDYEVTLFTEAHACLAQLHKRPDIICIDYGLPDMDGEKLLGKILSHSSGTPVIIISGQEEIAVAVSLLKAGATDYIIKDEHAKDLLWRSILKIRENSNLKKEVEHLKEQLEQKYTFENSIIGQSDVLKKTFRQIEKAANSTINISITGETGTGKELVARAVHFNSDRKKKPFIAVNMAAIPKELVESELFGHEKGAFTGAVNQKEGKFEAANGGTLFLDEIGELDLNHQSKLLRILQEREVVRIGSNKVIKFDARIITATHKNLAEEVKAGNFREDLYYRIVGLPIELPPLRQRGQDILILAKHFVQEYAKENKLKKAPVLSNEAKDKLMKYNFPGNIRELKAIIDLACVMCDSDVLMADDITFHTIKGDELFTATEKTMREYNADIISFFLNKYNQNVVEVAKKLDVGKSTIYNMIKAGEVESNK